MSYNKQIDSTQYKCAAAKKGCKCEGCEDCKKNAQAERDTQAPTAYEE